MTCRLESGSEVVERKGQDSAYVVESGRQMMILAEILDAPNSTGYIHVEAPVRDQGANVRVSLSSRRGSRKDGALYAQRKLHHVAPLMSSWCGKVRQIECPTQFYRR